MTRVIAGVARGRRLTVPPGRSTRPTSDRTREGLFATVGSLLGPLAGRRILDLYAGSGAVGLEALSRGAEHVLLVESDPRAVGTIRANIRALDLPGAQVLQARAEKVVARPCPGPPYDLAFADPPYATNQDALAAVLRALRDNGWLAPGALVALERPSRGGPPVWPDGYKEEQRPRRYGDATLWYGHVGPPRDHGTGVCVVHRVVCPGSFDPVTNGHLDILGRASRLYDEVVVAVLINVSKRSLFAVDERIDMLREVTKHYGNVSVDKFHGLLVDFCKARGIPMIVKGLRAVSDFDYELQMAQMNHSLAEIETTFMATNPLYSFLSSSLVKEIAAYGGDVSGLVPELVKDRLAERLADEGRD